MTAVTHFLLFSQLPGFAPFSGAENHLFTLAKGQKEAGMDVELVMLIDVDGPLLAAKAAELRRQGIAVYQMHLINPALSKYFIASDGSRRRPLLEFAFKMMERPRAFLRLYKFLRRRRDHIIHTHLGYAIVRVKILAWLAGCRKIISSFHGTDPFYLTFKLRAQLRVLDKVTCHSIAISENVKQFFSAGVGLNAAKITTVYYGIEPPLQNEAKMQLRQKYQIPFDGFVVGFVGRLTPQKNLALFIKALAHLPNIHGVIIGNGELDSELRRLATQLGAQNIQFLGHHPNAAQLMPAFDLFCLPSRWEGLGLVLLEAMFRKVPVLGSQAGAIPEILGQGQYGLLFSELDNPQELINQIQYAQTHPAELTAMACRAAEYAMQKFTVEAMVQKTIQVYALDC